MKNQELARTTSPDPVSFASVEAVVSLLGSMASLQHLLAALYARGEGVQTHALKPHEEDEGTTTHATADRWVDRAHKLAEILGWEGQRDLGEWIDDHPDRKMPRYLLPGGERTGVVQEALSAWYAVSPEEVREAAEEAARVASEDGYIGSRSQDGKKPAEDNPSAG